MFSMYSQKQVHQALIQLLFIDADHKLVKKYKTQTS